jgi:hypothetical protein
MQRKGKNNFNVPYHLYRDTVINKPPFDTFPLHQVFEAEKMISMRHVYHKKCFTCKECMRPMDQFIACDAPDGEK